MDAVELIPALALHRPIKQLICQNRLTALLLENAENSIFAGLADALTNSFPCFLTFRPYLEPLADKPPHI